MHLSVSCLSTFINKIQFRSGHRIQPTSQFLVPITCPVPTSSSDAHAEKIYITANRMGRAITCILSDCSQHHRSSQPEPCCIHQYHKLSCTHSTAYFQISSRAYLWFAIGPGINFLNFWNFFDILVAQF